MFPGFDLEAKHFVISGRGDSGEHIVCVSGEGDSGEHIRGDHAV